METIKSSKFKTARVDKRPNLHAQTYPYSTVTMVYPDNSVVKRGETCGKKDPLAQVKPETRTVVKVDCGPDAENKQKEMFTFAGEVSFEDFERWRSGELALQGYSLASDGSEEFMEVLSMEVQSH